MASPLIVPKFQFPSATPGSATSGFKVNTYVAGTSTPQATYNSSTLAVANANPVIMDANGQADIWLGNLSYKFVGTDASNNVLWTVDNVTQASLGQSQAEWVSFNATPTFSSATAFALTGISDLTVSPYFIAIGTRVRTVNTGGTIYSTVVAVAGNTLTVKNDSGVIDSGISSAAYGIIAGATPSLARRTYVATNGASLTALVNAVATAIPFNVSTVLLADTLNEFGGSTVLVKAAGTYRVSGFVSFNEGAATTGIQNVAQTVSVRKNGAAVATSVINWPIAASIASTQTIPFNFTLALAASDSIDISVTAGFTGTAPTASLTSFVLERVI